MKISSYELFIGENNRVSSNENKRKEAKEKFPFTTIVEGYYPEMDYSARWCWQNFGPIDCKECHETYSEYPGCPLIQATGYIDTGTYKDSAGIEHPWKEKRYKGEDVEKHSHEGVWTSVWFGKTGYDYGFTEICFKNEADRDKFIEAAPSFNFGENYEED